MHSFTQDTLEIFPLKLNKLFWTMFFSEWEKGLHLLGQGRNDYPLLLIKRRTTSKSLLENPYFASCDILNCFWDSVFTYHLAEINYEIHWSTHKWLTRAQESGGLVKYIWWKSCSPFSGQQGFLLDCEISDVTELLMKLFKFCCCFHYCMGIGMHTLAWAHHTVILLHWKSTSVFLPIWHYTVTIWNLGNYVLVVIELCKVLKDASVGRWILLW